MPFTSILKTLVENIPQATGAIVVDWEGEAVQEFCHCDPYEIRFSGAHQEIILKRLVMLHQKLEAGSVDSIAISTSTHHLIVGPITDEYSLALQVCKNAAPAVALYHFRAAVAALRREI